MRNRFRCLYDDTTLSEVLNVTNHRSDQPIGIMELNIQRISTFRGEQRIVLNAKKTKEMIFYFRVRKTTIRSMKMYDSEVERVTSFKLLETWLSQIAQKIWGRQRRICYNSIVV